MKKHKLGIALSGGGARGIAHLGVLQALEDHGYEIDCLSGTSAGAIVSLLYSAGKSPGEILSFVEEMSLLKTLRLGFPNKGLADLAYLKTKLEELIPQRTFEELNKKMFVAVANLNAGKGEIIHSGPVIDYVIASASIPMIFKPVILNDVTYVDGGLFNNLPVEPLIKHCEYIIGVNVLPVKEMTKKQITGMISIGARCFELVIRSNIISNQRHCDLIIEPQNITKFNLFNLGKAKDLFDEGYQEAVKVISNIKGMPPK